MKLLVSALEPSGNLHLRSLIEHLDGVEISGIFDSDLGSPIVSASEFGVMGIIDIIPKIALARRTKDEMVELARDMDAVLLIDAPAFNLPLAEALRKKYPDIKIYYYVLPKVWAWKKKRAERVKKAVTKMLSIFPFEDRFFDGAAFVGNPLLDQIKEFKDETKKFNRVAYLPGSRKREVRMLMPYYRELNEKNSERGLLVIAPHFSDEQIDELYGDISNFEVTRSVHETLLNSDFAYVCSGTATLEASIIGTPFVLVYKTNALEFAIGRYFVKLPYVGLANIIFNFAAKNAMHPELLQDELSVEAMIDARKEVDLELFSKNSHELRDLLQHGSAQRVAQIINGLV